MTKEEIKFLMQNGFGIHEIIEMGSGEKAPEIIETGVQTEMQIETPETSVDEHSEPKVEKTEFDGFRESIEDLQKELKKLGDRIAAQGVAGTAHETAVKSIDDTLAEIGRKLNGG